MKVILGPLVGQASGKLGGMVASRNRGGTYLRRRAHPVVVTSPEALATKARLAAVSAAWNDLTEAQREAWTLYAANNPITDRVGQKITLDGHTVYVKCNSLMSYIGAAYTTLPPTTPPPNALQTLSLTGDIGAGSVTAVFTATPLEAWQGIQLWANVEVDAARKYIEGRYRMCAISAGAQASPYDIQTVVEARLGTLQVGQVLHVRASVFDRSTGLRSLPLTAFVDITST